MNIDQNIRNEKQLDKTNNKMCLQNYSYLSCYLS